MKPQLQFIQQHTVLYPSVWGQVSPMSLKSPPGDEIIPFPKLTDLIHVRTYGIAVGRTSAPPTACRDCQNVVEYSKQSWRHSCPSALRGESFFLDAFQLRQCLNAPRDLYRVPVSHPTNRLQIPVRCIHSVVYLYGKLSSVRSSLPSFPGSFRPQTPTPNSTL